VNIFKQKILVIFLAVTAVLLLAGLALVYFNVDSLSTRLVLHFDAFKGVDLFGENADLWRLWGTGVLVTLLNAILGEAFFKKERMLTYIFLGVNILISLLLLLAISTIISVN
jgi:hypothetical protein